jgi:CRP-like cAMP-binding protein
MAATVYQEGSVIYKQGDVVEHVSLIGEGEVEGSFGGHTFLLGKSDVLGLSDLTTGTYTHTYTALSDVSLYQYPCQDTHVLDSLMRENADFSYLMVNSMCRQISEFLQYKERLKPDVDNAYNLIQDLYAEYSRLCTSYASMPKKLPGLEEIAQFSGYDPVEEWVHGYYTEIYQLDAAAHKAFFYGNHGIESGFIRRCIEDVSMVLQSCTAYHEYLNEVSALLLHEGGYDLFTLISQLHLDSLRITGADFAVESLMAPLTEALSDMTGIDADYYQERLDAYWNALEMKRESQDDFITSVPMEQGLNQGLVDSLDVILEYSECDEEMASTFTRCVHGYTELTDRFGTDDDVYDLRRDLTKAFYAIYKLVFMKSLDDSSPSTIINMFLNFGYVDPILAGPENANFLYSIADSYKGNAERNIYTIREWLTAIYNEEKQPSLSEFDMDFTAYVRDMKNSKQIDAKEETRLLADRDAKLLYEIENAFPVVNRVTYGNPTKFTPVFADHNVQRSLEDTLVTASAVIDIIDEIRSIDFSAFYRETSYSNQKLGVTNETISVEVLPNIILMPNIGLRGSMWQEIEGRIRTTPARMFMPVFLENDLKPLVMRLVADFRWEMCKRIQGARWNDMTDPSLTSYFCDYLQFYMNNRNIAMQTMTEIRNELSAARNNYKTVFVANYVVWLQNESRGMARLNSIAIGILMTFCPFVASIREQLKTNMRYNEALNRYNVKRQKRVQRLTLLVKKLAQSGKGIPQELTDELEFARR